MTGPIDRIKAPELVGGVAWLNWRSQLAGADAPVTLASLRGKVVLLHFWTYC